VQKSVFVAVNLEPKHLNLLLRDLKRFFPDPPPPGAPADQVLVVPLPNEQAGKIVALGYNNAIPDFEKILSKIL